MYPVPVTTQLGRIELFCIGIAPSSRDQMRHVAIEKKAVWAVCESKLESCQQPDYSERTK